MFALLVACVAVSCCWSQEKADLEQGLKSYGVYSGGDIDSVSVTNGNLNVHIPLFSYPQRGRVPTLTYYLLYNNKDWYQQKRLVNGVTRVYWMWRGEGILKMSSSLGAGV